MFRLLLAELRLRRGAIIGWGLGLAFFTLMVVALYPELEKTSILDTYSELEDMEVFAAMGLDLTAIGTFEGFLSAEMFLFTPLILAIYALLNGTGTMAGEEEEGTLELLMTLPLSRTRIALTKAIALGISVALILVAATLGGVIGFILVEINTDINELNLLNAFMNMWPIVMVFGLLGMLLSALTPRRAIATGLGAFILIVSYLIDSLSASIALLERIAQYLPFHYYPGGDVLTRNAYGSELGTLLAVCAALLLLTLAAFARRNVTAAVWPWQRIRIPA